MSFYLYFVSIVITIWFEFFFLFEYFECRMLNCWNWNAFVIEIFIVGRLFNFFVTLVDFPLRKRKRWKKEAKITHVWTEPEHKLGRNRCWSTRANNNYSSMHKCCGCFLLLLNESKYSVSCVACGVFFGLLYSIVRNIRIRSLLCSFAYCASRTQIQKKKNHLPVTKCIQFQISNFIFQN